jgi:formate dehydrogenase major subunit
MDLVKLEIDGKRIIADNRQTILEVARANGITNIPTLCHDGQLEPFASCFLCVVKVKGARTLLPACSTKVAGGMVVETDNSEVRRSRKAALELMLSNHYADCIGPCQLACPAGIDIQGYIALAALGQYADAIQLIKENNPLPAVCGRVCTRPCEVKGCRRNLMDEAVGIDYIKRYIADLDLGSAAPWRPQVAPANGRRVAVVGGGPAGLSCAYYLAVRGYGVEIFESQPEAGGMLRYGIPEYRLPKETLDLEINQILELGVTLRTNTSLGRDFTLASLRADGYDAVFMGIGAWDTSKMRVQDEDAPGVLPGIEFLREYGLNRAQPLPGRVLVVGGGNTAIDCARTSLRLGAAEVRLLYRRTRAEMPANEVEIEEGELEGVHMDFLVAPTRVMLKDGRACGIECLRMELGEPDASGRRSPKPIKGSEFVIDGDWIISAIGQSTLVAGLVGGKIPNFLPFGESLALTRWQTIQVNEKTFETSVDGVFSGGDVVTGAATAIEAIAAGRKAAHAIDQYVRTGKARPEPMQFNSRKDAFRKITVEDLRDGARYARRPMPALAIDERLKSFAEVETGYTAGDMRQESHRCLECGCVALFDCDLRRYATEYEVEIDRFLGEAKQYRVDRSHPLIELDPNKCVLCGRCVRMCSEVVGVAAYGFINRGFQTVVKPALGGALLDTGCVSCGLCIGTCPTGAIAEILPLAKPGPWLTVKTPTVCTFCGVGCRFNFDSYGDSLVKVTRFDDDAGATAGNHCRKGRFGYSLAQAPDRLRTAFIRAGRELQEAKLEDAVSYAAMRLKELCRRHPGDAVALFVSPRLTNEEIYLAQKFARLALGTHQVTTFAHLVNRDLNCPDVLSNGTYRDLEDAQAILVVGSELADEHFVADLAVKKALRKGGKLITIGPRADQTSRFADIFLQCAAGQEAEALLGLLAACAENAPDALADNAMLAGLVKKAGVEARAKAAGVAASDLRAAAGLLCRSILKVLVFNRDRRAPRVPGDARLYAQVASALGCGLLGLHEKANMQGVCDLGASPHWLPGYASTGDAAAIAHLEKEWCVALRGTAGAGADLAEALRQKKIKVAVVIGEDPLGAASLPPDLAAGLAAAEFLVVADLFPTATTRAAAVVLPLSSAAETSGTMTNSERRVQSLRRAMPPLAGVETWDLLCRLAAQMGFRFKMKYDSPAEVAVEIARLFPAWGAVAIDSADSDGTWSAAGAGLPPIPFDPARLTERVRPVLTSDLDHVEARFAAWFEETIAAAKAKLATEAAAVAP